MKAIFISCMMLLFKIGAVAQTFDTISLKQSSLPILKQKRIWYVSVPNLSYGNFYLLSGLGLTVMSKKQWGLSLESKRGSVNAKNLPADFKAFGFSFFGDDGLPDETNELFLLSAVCSFKMHSPKIIPTFQAGVSYTKREYPDNFVFVPAPTSFNSSWFNWGDTYDYEYKTSKSFGLYLKPGIKYMFTKKVAVSAALWTVLQQRNSYYGIELGLQFGRLR